MSESFNIDNLLAAADPILAVRQTTTVDTTSVVELLRRMGRRIEEQDAQIALLQSEVAALRGEMTVFRSQGEEYTRLRKDVSLLIDDVEAITAYQKLPKVPNRAREGTLRNFLAEQSQSRQSVSQQQPPLQLQPPPQQPQYQSTQYQQSIMRSNNTTTNAPQTPFSPVPGVPPQDGGFARADRESSVPRPNNNNLGGTYNNLNLSTTNNNMALQQHGQQGFGSPLPRGGSTSASVMSPEGQGERPRTGLTMEADADIGCLRVTDVKANSAAAEAGLLTGDLILMADNMGTSSTHDFLVVLERKRVGDLLAIKYQRDSTIRNTTLRLKSKNYVYVEDHQQ